MALSMEGSTVIHALPQAEKAISDDTKTCGICYLEPGKYTCSRCNISYCSVNCFKATKHSGCSESFYRDCFMEEMKSNRVSDGDKIKAMKLLRSFEDSFQDEEEECTLSMRLKNIDLDDAENVWMELTAEEQEDFYKSIESGSLVTEWKPWWLEHETRLVTDLSCFSDDEQTKCTVLPDVSLNVPRLCELMPGKEPSPLVQNNLVEVLYGYSYFCHKYNGCLKEFKSEAALKVIRVSTFLSKSLTSVSLAEAIQRTMDMCSKENEGCDIQQELLEAILDVYHILLGPNKDNLGLYAKTAVGEVHLCCKALKKSKNYQWECDARLVKTVMKKLEFLYAWLNEYTFDLLPLSMATYEFYKDKVSFMKSHEMLSSKGTRLRKQGNRKLIEELT